MADPGFEKGGGGGGGGFMRMCTVQGLIQDFLLGGEHNFIECAEADV